MEVAQKTYAEKLMGARNFKESDRGKRKDDFFSLCQTLNWNDYLNKPNIRVY